MTTKTHLTANNRRYSQVMLGIVLAVSAVSVADTSDANAPPNLIIMVADDMGWADVGYHGSPIATPTIDRLATAGVQLDRFYAWPSCSPTRLGLLSGRSPIRSGVTEPVGGGNDLHLPSLDEHFLGQTLQAAGYQTWLCGKWHLGGNRDTDYRPNARGFDHFYGLVGGAVDYFDHSSPNGRPDWYRNEDAIEEEGYSTFLFRDEATDLIRNRDPNHPFYLQLSFNAAHTPLQAPAEYVDKYGDLNSEAEQLYAAMVDAMDEAMGSVLDTIADEGLTDNTLVLFFSDNGASRTAYGGGSNAPLRGRKGQVYEGGIRLPAAIYWPGVLEGGRICSQVTAVIDLFPTLATALDVIPQNTLPFDGVDRWDQFLGTAEDVLPQDLVIVGGENQAAILHDGWKLIQFPAENPDRFELYDISADPTESDDLSNEHSELVQLLSDKIAVQAGWMP